MEPTVGCQTFKVFILIADSHVELYVGIAVTIVGVLVCTTLLTIFRKEPVVEKIIRVINTPFWFLYFTLAVIFYILPQLIWIKLKKKCQYLLRRTSSSTQEVRIELRNRQVGVGCPQFSLWTPPESLSSSTENLTDSQNNDDTEEASAPTLEDLEAGNASASMAGIANQNASAPIIIDEEKIPQFLKKTRPEAPKRSSSLPTIKEC